MFEKFDEPARRSLFFARYEASRARCRAISSEHLLLGILREGDARLCQVLDRLGLEIDELREGLIGETVPIQRASTSPDLPLDEEAKKILAFAVHEAQRLGHAGVGTDHILLGLLRVEDGRAAVHLRDFGLNLELVRDLVSRVASDSEAETADEDTPHLSEYSRDLTLLAARDAFDPLIGREVELERIIQILCRRTKNNPLLLGEAGVGKTAIVEGLATRIVEGRVPSLLEDRRILSIDLSLLVAGTKYRGQFEERLKGFLKELQEHEEVIIFIDEIHSLVGTGSAEGSLDAANILKPALSRGELVCIGATTVREYRKYVERDRALSRRFQAVSIRQPTESETSGILRGIRSRYEDFHGVHYTDEAVGAAVAHSARYITDRFFPDKAIDVMDEAGARVKLRRAESTGRARGVRREAQRVVARMKEAISRKRFDLAVELREEEIRLREELEMLETTREARPSGEVTVTRADIEEVVSSWTGVPVTALEEDEADRLRKMEQTLGRRVVGQSAALEAVARSIRRSRLGVTNPNRPVGSFIFLGPSGVGKTEVARQLARFLFQDPRRLIRFDMSEYMEKHTVSRLIGSPPGYVGFEEGGQLSDRLRHNPYSVVLLDEIEKAHPDVYNLLLQVLEDGRLTDNYGNLIDFTNSIIIMTSNLGSRSLVDGTRVGFFESSGAKGRGEISGIVERELKRHFPPEFLNRLDDVVVFGALGEEDLLEVAKLLLEETAENLVRSDVDVRFSPHLPSWLVARAGVDPHAGARPLRRLIQCTVEDAVADYLIEHRVQKPRLRVALRDDRPYIEEMTAVTQLGESL